MFTDVNEKYETLCAKLDALTNALHEFPRNDQQHSPQMREWEPFLLRDGGVASGGVATVGGLGTNLIPAPNGWEAQVARITLVVTGSSGSTTGAVFRGQAQYLNLVDRIATVTATVIDTVTYYTNISEYTQPIYFPNDEPLTLSISGAAATAQAFVVVRGVRRQL